MWETKLIALASPRSAPENSYVFDVQMDTTMFEFDHLPDQLTSESHDEVAYLRSQSGMSLVALLEGDATAATATTTAAAATSSASTSTSSSSSDHDGADSECDAESVSRPTATRAKSSSDEKDQLRAIRRSQHEKRRLRNAAKQLRREQRKNEIAERRQRSLDDVDAALAEFGLR